jgi:hypothetical protein
MKNINITKKHSMQNPIEFCIGNGQRIKFSSKREANAFIADTNRYLTKCLVILNNSYVELIRQYRQFWMVATNTNSGTSTNYMALSARIKGQLSAADEMMEKFSSTWAGSNDPFFAFIDLNKVAWFLKTAADLMYDHYKYRGATAEYYNCLVLSERCELVQQQLKEYTYHK